MTAVMALRERYTRRFEKKHGVKLGFMSFFVKAAIDALKELPAVNAEIDGDDIVYKNHYDIGVAVGTEQGLVVPVVRDADRLSFAEIEKDDRRARPQGARRQADDRGPDGRHLHDHQRRRLRLAAVDADPQPAASGILGMHEIQKRPVAVERPGRDPADDVRRAVLRPPHHRRPRGGDVPGARSRSASRTPSRLLLEI